METHFKKLNGALLNTFVAMLLVVCAMFSRLFEMPGTNIVLVNFLSGFAVAFLFLVGVRCLSGIIAGVLISHVLFLSWVCKLCVFDALSGSIVSSIGQCSEIVVCYFTARLVLKKPIISSASNMFIFAAIAGCACLLNAVVSTFVFDLCYLAGLKNYVLIAEYVWVSDFIGILMFAPLIIGLFSVPFLVKDRRLLRRSFVTFLIFGVAGCVVFAIAYVFNTSSAIHFLIIPAILLLLVRTRLHISLGVVTLVCLFFVKMHLLQYSVLDYHGMERSHFAILIYCIILYFMALVIATSIKERNDAYNALEESYNENERMLEQQTFYLNISNAGLKGEIEQRKKAEQEKEETSRQFELIFEQSPDGLILYRSDGVYARSNETAKLFFGASCEENLFEKSFLTKTLLDGLKDGQSVIVEVEENDGQPGNGKWYKNSIIVVANDRLGPGGKSYLLVSSDITLSKRAEINMNSYNRNLEAEVSRRTEELRDANKKLAIENKEKLETLDALKSSELKFQNIFSNSPVATGVVKVNGRKVIDVNERWCELFNVDKNVEIGSEFPHAKHWLNDIDIRTIESFITSDYSVRNYEIPYVNDLKRDGVCAVSVEKFDLEGEKCKLLMIRDISERKKMQKELLESEEKYRNLINSATDGIVIIKNGLINFVNQAMLDMMDVSYDEVIGHSFTEFLVEEEASLLMENYRKRMAGEDVAQILQANLQHDGKSLFIEISMSLFVYHGDVAELVFVRDISERKRAIDAITTSEKRFKTVFSKSPIAMSVWMLETGELVDVNDSFCVLTGYSYTELIGKRGKDIILINRGDTHTPELDDFMRRLHEEGRVENFPLTISTKTGESRFVKCFSERIFINNKDFVISQNQDITIQKSIEEELSRYQRHLEEMVQQRTLEFISSEHHVKELLVEQRTILDTAQVGIALEKKGCFVWVNRKMTELLAAEEPGLLGKPLSILFAREGAFADFSETAIKILASGGTYTADIELTDATGKNFWASVNARAIESGNAGDGAIWIVENIAKRKEEEALLRDARDAAERVNLMKSEFIANISHEVRTPMNSILGFAEILQVKLCENPECKTYAREIMVSGTTLMTLLNDILDLSKMESGTLHVVREPVDIRQLLHELVHVFNAKVMQKGLQIRFSVSENVPQNVMLDQLRLRQVLFNIVGNAVKFTGKGFVEVEVTCVEIDGSLIDLQVTVSDSGIGMPADVLPFIFDPFNQSEPQNTRKHQGTGLGLSISKRLTQLMGGEITVQSIEGEGTKIILIFRSIEVDEKRVDENDPGDFEYDFGNAKVLVVDDMDIHRMVIKGYLELSKLTVLTADNGQHALQVMKGTRPDIILMDISMPVMDGISTVEVVRNSPEFAMIPVIALSVVDLASASGNGLVRFNDFMQKPVRLSILIAKMAKFLPHKKVRKQQATSLKEQVIQWSKKYQGNVDEFAAIFLKDIAPLCKSIEVSLDFDKLDELATILHGVGTTFSIDDIVALSGKLKGYMKTTDIENSLLTIQGLLEIGEFLKDIKNGTN